MINKLEIMVWTHLGLSQKNRRTSSSEIWDCHTAQKSREWLSLALLISSHPKNMWYSIHMIQLEKRVSIPNINPCMVNSWFGAWCHSKPWTTWTISQVALDVGRPGNFQCKVGVRRNNEGQQPQICGWLFSHVGGTKLPVVPSPHVFSRNMDATISP